MSLIVLPFGGIRIRIVGNEGKLADHWTLTFDISTYLALYNLKKRLFELHSFLCPIQNLIITTKIQIINSRMFGPMLNKTFCVKSEWIFYHDRLI